MEVHGDSTARPKVVAGQGVQVGDHNNQVNNFFIAPRVPVEWPHRVGVVPTLAEGWLFRVAEGGVGPGWAATETYCHILCGLGGTGKTQMAAGWAQDAWRRQEVDLLVWVDASTRTGITAVYAQAAADVTGVADADAGQAAARFLAWLAGTDRRWLIVLDDLMKPGDLGGLWPPATASGRTVVTTRRRDAALAGAGRLPWPVGVFTEPEAAAYLTAKFSDRSGTAQEIAALAADLGYLPLALAQASAYIVDRDLSCAEYRDRLADERRRLADLVPEPGALPDEHHQTVATTWALSIELADRLQPAGLARPLLSRYSPRPRWLLGSTRCATPVGRPVGTPSGTLSGVCIASVWRRTRSCHLRREFVCTPSCSARSASNWRRNGGSRSRSASLTPCWSAGRQRKPIPRSA
jgi:hypothetical protein